VRILPVAFQVLSQPVSILCVHTHSPEFLLCISRCPFFLSLLMITQQGYFVALVNELFAHSGSQEVYPNRVSHIPPFPKPRPPFFSSSCPGAVLPGVSVFHCLISQFLSFRCPFYSFYTALSFSPVAVPQFVRRASVDAACDSFFFPSVSSPGFSQRGDSTRPIEFRWRVSSFFFFFFFSLLGLLSFYVLFRCFF